MPCRSVPVRLTMLPAKLAELRARVPGFRQRRPEENQARLRSGNPAKLRARAAGTRQPRIAYRSPVRAFLFLRLKGREFLTDEKMAIRKARQKSSPSLP